MEMVTPPCKGLSLTLQGYYNFHNFTSIDPAATLLSRDKKIPLF
jgi:hypothetical protein